MKVRDSFPEHWRGFWAAGLGLDGGNEQRTGGLGGGVLTADGRCSCKT